MEEERWLGSELGPVWPGAWSGEDKGVVHQVRGGATEQREDHTPVANVRSICKEESQPEAWYNLRLWTKGSLALNKRTVGPFLYTLRDLRHVFLAPAGAIQGLLL